MLIYFVLLKFFKLNSIYYALRKRFDFGFGSGSISFLPKKIKY